ncbi:Major Facilitator Superfamily protein [Dietzia kunjamensis subsp. schimae]|uniref:Major Facilitator Superfamily protein n=1 Tax=Dietzia kunjamensis subsp. schimae TaxID=498198 RepID=A0ABY1N1P0_9ACTN|nr:MFS transporter [Dietzia kunjamensis]SMO73481.1 Major Facilitator Superfamily protein [Dietzia kunjamensis subsp. schimae]
MTRAGDATHTAPEASRATAQRRILTVLVLAQLLAGAGLAAGITVGALLAEDLLGGPGLSGLPSALFTGGSALAAIAVGKLSQARGRRPGLAAGFAVGALGAVGIVAATALESLPLLFLSFVIYGSGTATNLQARYAGADLATDATRARSLSYVLLGTTAGAVAGPNLVGPTGVVAEALGLAPLAGPFLLAAAAYGGAALVISLLLRPDPLLEARRMEIAAAEAALTSSSSSSTPSPSSSPSPAAEAAAPAADSERHAVAPVPTRIWTADVITGVVVMALTQFVMVGLMTMTPVHMRAHDHTVTVVGVVISLHVAAMFLPAPLSGLLVDKFGTRAVAVSAGLVLLAAGGLAALAPPQSTALVALALILLGLGWSLGLVAGTTVLTTSVPTTVRASVQGQADVAVALSGAAGGLLSGLVFAWIDFRGLGFTLAALSLVVVAAVRPRTARRTVAPASTV